MPTRPTSEADLRLTVQTFDAAGRNFAETGRQLGLTDSAIRNRLRHAQRLGLMGPTGIEFPDFVQGDDQTPIAEILRRKTEDFTRAHSAASARKWFPIKVGETLPYGLLMFGDPHIDDNGCNLPLLQKHIDIAKQPGIYGLNIGDSSNNWVGRLMRLYADQDTSETTAKRLVEWFMFDSGVTWLCWILGNHDIWNRGSEFHRRLGVEVVPVVDWHAQFKLAHPNGTDVKVDAAHGRKGNSIWNNIHSTLRAAKLSEHADLFVTGHTHNFALEDIEIPERGTSVWLAQLRGYKFMDSHALHHGYPEHQRGASVLAVIDPRKGVRTRLHCFEDVEAGADWLAFHRKRAA